MAEASDARTFFTLVEPFFKTFTLSKCRTPAEARLFRLQLGSFLEEHNFSESAFEESDGDMSGGEWNRPNPTDRWLLRAQADLTPAIIARAGGLSSNAFLYGIVFTRESTRQQQQEKHAAERREDHAGRLSATTQK